jgi:hypothetical protein
MMRKVVALKVALILAMTLTYKETSFIALALGWHLVSRILKVNS